MHNINVCIVHREAYREAYREIYGERERDSEIECVLEHWSTCETCTQCAMHSTLDIYRHVDIQCQSMCEVIAYA